MIHQSHHKVHMDWDNISLDNKEGNMEVVDSMEDNTEGVDNTEQVGNKVVGIYSADNKVYNMVLEDNKDRNTVCSRVCSKGHSTEYNMLVGSMVVDKDMDNTVGI